MKVWWNVDKEFYEGTITAAIKNKGGRYLFTVEYDDGDVESKDFLQDIWSFVPGNPHFGVQTHRLSNPRGTHKSL